MDRLRRALSRCTPRPIRSTEIPPPSGWSTQCTVVRSWRSCPGMSLPEIPPGNTSSIVPRRAEKHSARSTASKSLMYSARSILPPKPTAVSPGHPAILDQLCKDRQTRHGDSIRRTGAKFNTYLEFTSDGFLCRPKDCASRTGRPLHRKCETAHEALKAVRRQALQRQALQPEFTCNILPCV